MTLNANPLLLGDDGGYNLTRSLRFRSSASASLTRTPATASNRKTFTWSGWVKRGTLSTYQNVFGATTGGYPFLLRFDNDNTIFVYQDGAADYGGNTSAVYRDPAAWYHIVLAIDTTQATDTNRLKLYVNGVQVSVNPTYGYFALNVDTSINSTGVHSIGGPSANYFDGYLAEVNFIDGQALTPSSFGAFSIYNQWLPKKYAGTYGTNGFYLPFTNNASAATLGNDFSGNSNNWTTNNISVTTGSTYDSTTDVPTLTSATAANYATFNPLDIVVNTASNGNLKLTNTSTAYGACRATIAIPTTGKCYWETVVTAQDTTVGSWFGVGMMIQSIALNAYVGETVGVIFYGDRNDAITRISNGITVVYTGTVIAFATGDILQCAYDADSGKFWFGKNNLWWNSSVGTTGDPSAGTNQTLTAAAGTYFPFVQLRQAAAGTSIADINFGQRPFSYTPPSGFVALNTFNLPTGSVTTNGTFTGNANADGPFVYLNGVPTTMTINGNAVTFGTHSDKLANGFKVRSSSSSYNTSGSNTYSVSTTGATFKNSNAQGNP
jgi:hypothetical protein